MHKQVVVASTAFLLLAVAACDSDSEGGGLTVLGDRLVDLGKVRAGERVSVDYTVRNTGTVEVEVLEFELSCSCQALRVDGKADDP